MLMSMIPLSNTSSNIYTDSIHIPLGEDRPNCECTISVVSKATSLDYEHIDRYYTLITWPASTDTATRLMSSRHCGPVGLSIRCDAQSGRVSLGLSNANTNHSMSARAQ